MNRDPVKDNSQNGLLATVGRRNPLLRVEELQVDFATRQGRVAAVRGINFHVGQEKLGIVGESGSGKSQTARAILGLLPSSGRLQARRLEFAGIDLLHAGHRQWRAIRGRRIALIMQDPHYSLNPVLSVGQQLDEAYRVHFGGSRHTARQKALDMLQAVRIRDPQRVLRAYPQELSGGMGQRVMIAMMLLPEPDLLIADEPTSALDVTVSLRVLAILDDLVTQRGMGLILISHDLNLVASFCDRILIMYGGKIMEECAADRLHQAQHPYTRGLLDCLPAVTERRSMLPVLQRDPAWLD
ncbi:MAG: ABC transporter ATP-binding protein [Candidatus Competibacteraceae bacterium]|jgi:peptide/nickel transport system ATP-binding protein|nr:ABC transporter ATP-binding protein [Candidatus Competibacteraceae bacterium]